jgi:hypothetical protein
LISFQQLNLLVWRQAESLTYVCLGVRLKPDLRALSFPQFRLVWRQAKA